jgi:hypothetical protein
MRIPQRKSGDSAMQTAAARSIPPRADWGGAAIIGVTIRTFEPRHSGELPVKTAEGRSGALPYFAATPPG